MEKHYRNIKNEMAYFNKVVKNMDLDDIEKEKKHANNNVHYEEFLFENSDLIFEIEIENKHSGRLRWIDLIQNEALHGAIEKLSDEEKYFITLLFYEEKTQKELAVICKISESTVFYKINKIMRKIKKYMLGK